MPWLIKKAWRILKKRGIVIIIISWNVKKSNRKYKFRINNNWIKVIKARIWKNILIINKTNRNFARINWHL
jgi:hypothetical protein